MLLIQAFCKTLNLMFLSSKRESNPQFSSNVGTNSLCFAIQGLVAQWLERHSHQTWCRSARIRFPVCSSGIFEFTKSLSNKECIVIITT